MQVRAKDAAMGDNVETAVLAGGCFWGIQELMRRHPGVVASRTGWTGGDIDHPTEENPGTHAEATEITFDPEQTSYRDILELFFQIHDPTTLNRQMDDVGTWYRSAIFYTNHDQLRVAEETIADVDASGLWPGKVVTELAPAGRFWEADQDDQYYLQRHPDGETCHFPRPDWKLPRRATVS
jgi:peptide-methionine (S)-S-oxide reductase